MQNYIKWILMVLGLSRGSLVGGFIGFIVGYLIEEVISGNLEIRKKEIFKAKEYNYNSYQQNLLSLISEIVKADGYISKKEIYFIKDYLMSQFGSIYTNKMLKTLKLTVDKTYNVEKISLNLKGTIDNTKKINLVRFLYGITTQNGSITEKERILVKTIAKLIGLSKTDYENIVFRNRKQSSSSNYSNNSSSRRSAYSYNPYAVLEITKSATDKEIKKAYRKMVLKYHPDKSDMDDDIANEKFSAISEAYHTIKKQRGIK